MAAAPSRADIFRQLHDFLHHDLWNVLGMEHGGNYTAALLIVVGAEALSLLRGDGPDVVFTQLLTKHGLDPLVAGDIASALRNGLAHSFETKFVQVGPRRVELVVSWGQQQHLRREADPPRLFLNVRTMWDDLLQELTAFEERLNRDLLWAKRPSDGWAKQGIHQCNPKARAAWDALFRP